MSFKIAIDGPSSSGKSTLAKKIASKLDYVYIDTGAMYRAMGFYFLKNGIDLKDEELISSHLDNVNIEINYVDGKQQVILNGEDIASLIRTEEIGNAGSIVSTYQLVREKLVELQQKMADVQNVVMDGRDIGTVVLPNADIKIYLNADCHERAIRRHQELLEKGLIKTLEEVELDLKERDYRDMNRKNSPLRKADDAIEIDSTNLDIEQVVDKVLNIVREKEGK